MEENEENSKKTNKLMKFIKDFFSSKTFIIYTMLIVLISIILLVKGDSYDFSFVIYMIIFCYFTVLFVIILPIWAIERASTDKQKEQELNKNENNNESMNKEYRKKCNVCGHIFCYTDKDIAVNNERIKSADRYQIKMFTQGLMRNNKIDWRYNQEKMEQHLDKIIDFSKCPNCGSTDLIDYDNEKQTEEKININSTDEIIKYKELLDKGILTQEEFDKKKKELLKL